ncbi:Protein of unknown function [Gryllus bimaculatus]|nr:Protein of unknown function [Gryllus bimaculatus]
MWVSVVYDTASKTMEISRTWPFPMGRCLAPKEDHRYFRRKQYTLHLVHSLNSEGGRDLPPLDGKIYDAHLLLSSSFPRPGDSHQRATAPAGTSSKLPACVVVVRKGGRKDRACNVCSRENNNGEIMSGRRLWTVMRHNTPHLLLLLLLLLATPRLESINSQSAEVSGGSGAPRILRFLRP